MKGSFLFVIVLISCLACGKKEQPPQPDIAFDKTKWGVKNKYQYTYRRQMVNDLVKNYNWQAVTTDSLLQMLGQPDDIEVDVFYLYYYEQDPIMGGVMTSHKAITYELTPDKLKVKSAKLAEGAEWGY